jgi:DnaA family protein
MSSGPAGGQLALALAWRPESNFTEYLPGPNAEVTAAIAAWAKEVGSDDGGRFLYLHGPSGTGKTHLLQAACREGHEKGLAVAYLPMDHPGLTPAVLDELEHLDRIALDGLDAIASAPDWEEALFHLYNRLREGRRALLVAARAPAAELGIHLPDLVSRLAWGPSYRLRPLDEGGCAALLRLTAERRGLHLGDEVIAYILKRHPREPRQLLALLDALDQASLIHKRRPSLALIRGLSPIPEL